jgi:predicted  nucleic acid-binding Zn-ribbon protein
MGLLDFLFKREPKTLLAQISALQQKKRMIEMRLSEAQLRLDRERAKPMDAYKHMVKIDHFEREVAIWTKQKQKVDEELAKFQ